MKLSENKKLRNDLILVLAVLLLAAGCWLWIELSKEEGNFAVVVVDGVETEKYPLSVDTEVRLGRPDGGYNILVIKNGQADVVEASCPDKICVNQRKISRTGETITCLPNKTVIKIVGADPNSSDDIDFMS